MATAIPLDTNRTTVDRFDWPFYLILLYIVLEYGRPQNYFSILEILRPGLIIQSVLLFFLIVRKAVNFNYIQTKYYLLLLLVMAIHVPIATNNFLAYETLRAIFLYFIVYLSIANFVNSSPKIKKFINYWLIINLICAIVGIINGGKVPNSGLMGDENDFALVMVMSIPFAYFIFLHANSFRIKVFYFSAVLIFTVAIITSFSRGGFLGLAAVGLFCWWNTSNKFLAIVGLLLIVSFLYLTINSDYIDEILSIKEQNIEEGTGKERWYSWQCAWRMFLDNPVIGVGQGNFPIHFDQYRPIRDLGMRTSYWGRAAHSLYFTLFPELGMVGVYLYFNLLYRSLKSLKISESTICNKFNTINDSKQTEAMTNGIINELKPFVFGVKGAFIGYFIAGAFLSVLYYPHFWILIGLSATIAYKYRKTMQVDIIGNKSN